MFLIREMSYLKSLDFQMFHTGPQTVVVFLELGRNLIEGVLFPPKPLRSEAFPRGIPDVVNGLKSSKRRKLNDDTEMAELSAEQCIIAHKRGRFFSLEHPFNSISPTPYLVESPPGGVRCSTRRSINTCMFEGSKRRKNQILIPQRQGAG